MKKLLVIFLAMFSIVAHAQSSVTVYGLLDLAYIGTNYKGVGINPNIKQTQSMFGQTAQSPSRLGFRGTEDLGGGMSAFFTVETSLNPQNGVVSTWSTRQSFLGIKKDGYGKIAFGTQNTGVFKAIAVTDAGNINTMIGDVINATSVQAYGNPGGAPYGDPSGNSGASTAYTIRTTNTVTLETDRYNGFSANGFYTLNNRDTTQTSATTGGPTNASGWGIGANYSRDKLYVTAAYQTLKSVVPGTLTTPQPMLWTTNNGGVNTSDTQKYVAATYDFGIVKTYVQWLDRKGVSTINTNYFANRSAQQIGVRGYWTPTIESWASIGNGKISAFGANQPSASFVGWQVGTNYWLSKRTNLYAIYGQSQTARLSQSIGATGASNYAVGVRHSF